MTTHLLQSVAATASAKRPMYFVALKMPPTGDPFKAKRFTRADAERIQRCTAGWLAAVPRPKPETWGARS